MIQTTTPGGVISTFAYDDVGNLVKADAGVGGLRATTQFTYTALGQVETVMEITVKITVN